MVFTVKGVEDCIRVLELYRNDDKVLNNMFKRATQLNEEEITMPRLTASQRNRKNVAPTNASDYNKRAVYYPFIDTCIKQLSERFQQHSSKAYQLSALLPSVCMCG